MRAFVAGCLDPDLRARIGSAQAELAGKLGALDVRWTAVEQVHLTLRFFGNIAVSQVEHAKQALQRATDNIGIISLKVQGFGCFPSDEKPQVLWLGLKGDVAALEQLQERIERETSDLGLHSEKRKFHPHLTIGRVRETRRPARQVVERVRSSSIGELGEWPLKEITLMQSRLTPRGSIYTPLATLALAGSEGR